MSHITCSDLAYAHPGGDLLFSDVAFTISPGQHVGIVGINGVGKSTLLRVLTGELTADNGETSIGGRVARMPQDIGTDDDDLTVRELLLSLLPSQLRDAGLDRDFLVGSVNSILTLEGNGCWMHDGSYSTYAAARTDRQRRLGDAVKRWNEEERRLRNLTRLFKERARYSPVWAKKANAMETRWRRFADAGPPSPPITDQYIQVRLRGADSARRVVQMTNIAIDELILAFSEEVYFGERIGLIGPNGGGKTHLMRMIAGINQPDAGELILGPRVSPGLFTQTNTRKDFIGRKVLEIVQERLGSFEKAMGSLARYGLVEAARRDFDTLSGGQRARLEILCLDIEGHNLLLLDEPTDNLDVESAEALEQALDSFQGTVVAVSHDRAFLRCLDRFLLVLHDGTITAVPSYEIALEALAAGGNGQSIRLAKRLTH